MTAIVRSIVIYTTLMLVQGCALLEPEHSTKETAPAEPQPEFALLEPQYIDEDFQEWQSLREELKVTRSQAGYYIDVQEAQLNQKLMHTNTGLYRVGDAILLRISGITAFDTNSSQLNADVQPQLASISEVLSEFRNTLVVVNSHTDIIGDADYNQRLSEQRAIAVGRFLVEHGVSPERIAVVGHGESRPLNDQNNDRWSNRRIEIRLELVIDEAPSQLQ